MPKPNYGHAKRQKETARKLRQQKKLERRQTRVPAEDPGPAAHEPAAPAGDAAP